VRLSGRLVLGASTVRLFGSLAQLLELLLHIRLSVVVSVLGSSERFEHGTKRQLNLRRVDRFGFLPEQLAFDPLKLV
jgi:hypothetical protein